MRLPVGTRVIVVLAVLVGVALPGDVGAESLSPAISPARIHVETPVRQGQAVQLPGLGVSNRGDEAARYEVAVTPVANDEALAVPSSWIRLQPSTFDLGPGEGRVVGVWLDIPGNGTPGDYRARLRATAASSGPTKGTAVSLRAAVASDLRFSVIEHHPQFFDPLVAWLNVHAGWLGASIAVFSGTLLMLEVRERYRFRLLRRERDG